MGLMERRWADKFATKILPDVQQEQEKACGFKIPFEIAHDSFESDGQAYLLLEHGGLKEVHIALKELCKRDAISRDAVRDGIKRVAFRNVEEAEKNAVALKAGVLEVTWAWGKGKKDLLGSRAIREVLEKSL